MKKWILLALVLMLVAKPVLASEGGEAGHGSVLFLVVLTLLVIPAKLAGAAIGRFGMPQVVGHILVGIVFSYLSTQVDGLHTLFSDSWIQQSAMLGSVILLFVTGLESSVEDMVKVGKTSMLMALIGMAGPLVLVFGGVTVLSLLNVFEASFNTALFIAASLTATSVGIPAEIYAGEGITKHSLSQTVIGAGVIDDIGGVTLLSVLRGFLAGAVSPVAVIIIIAKAMGFLVLGILLGRWLAKPLAWLVTRVQDSHGMQFSMVFGLMAVYAYMAELVGLAPIIGAYAAGLFIESARHLSFFSKPMMVKLLEGFLKKRKHDEELEEMLEQLKEGELLYSFKFFRELFVPLFFVLVGIQIDVQSLANLQLYPIAFVVFVAAFAGKAISGWAVTGTIWERAFCGVSMVIRGEVGLVFASLGVSLGVLSPDQFSLLIIVILLTTVVPIPLLKVLIRKANLKESAAI